MFQPLIVISEGFVSMEWNFLKPLNSNRRYIYLFMKSSVKKLDGNMNPTPLVTINDDLSQYFKFHTSFSRIYNSKNSKSLK
jgi:hypothetical protein